MKTCSTSPAIREMQIETATRGHLPPVRTAVTNQTGGKCWRGWGAKATLPHCRRECKLVPALRTTAWRFLRKLRIKLPYDPATPLLGIQPPNLKTFICKAPCIPTVTAASSTVVRTLKRRKWLDKEGVAHTYNGILSGDKKRWNTAIFDNMDRSENIMLSKISKTKKLRTIWFHSYVGHKTESHK